MNFLKYLARELDHEFGVTIAMMLTEAILETLGGKSIAFEDDYPLTESRRPQN